MDILLEASGHGTSRYHQAPAALTYDHASGPLSYYEEQGQSQYRPAADIQDHGDAPIDAPAPSATEVTHELWLNKTPQPRGRHAKDPHAEYVRFDCKDIDDLEANLAEYLSAPTAPAEHATIEFHFPVTAAFMVYTRDFKRDPSTQWTPADVTDLVRRTAVSVVEVLQDTPNPKDQIVRQKAVARIIVEAVQRADGFRYSFHNNWLSREDRAHRFSYFCNDSTLNKGRAANSGLGMENRKITKPVYACKGLIAIKFSLTKNNLEVHYRHVPLHKTFAERAPPPRRASKRRRLLEILDPKAAEELPRSDPRAAKKKKKEEVKPSAPKKTGRPNTASRQPRRNANVNTHGQQLTDEGLQPMIDFLGSVEREAQVRGDSAPEQGVDSDNDSNGGGIIMVDDDDLAAEADNPAVEVTLFPHEKIREMQTHQPPRKKPIARPMLPGEMEGTFLHGNITWGVDASADLSSKPVDNVEKEQGNAVQHGRKNRPSAAADDAASVPLSELELLKQQLAATQERLERLESEKRQSPLYPPYPPPYPYPHYPYPPPPQGYYPTPPPPPPPPCQVTLSPSKQPQYTVSDASFRHVGPPVSAGPPMYPGGPPYPAANAVAPAPLATQSAFLETRNPALQCRPDQLLSHVDPPAQPGSDAHPAQLSEKDSQSQPVVAGAGNSGERAVEQELRPATPLTATRKPPAISLDSPQNGVASQRHSQSQTQESSIRATPQFPLQSRPASALEQGVLQLREPVAPSKDASKTSAVASNQPIMGVLETVDAADEATSLVRTGTPSRSKRPPQQPLGGALKLVEASKTPGAREMIRQSEDAKMKGYFHNTLDAVQPPTLPSAPSAVKPRTLLNAAVTVKTPTSTEPSSANKNQSHVWSGPTYAQGYAPHWQADYAGKLPPASQHHACPPPQEQPPQHGFPYPYPYPYPYPPPQYPYQGYGPLPPSGYPPCPLPPAGGHNRGSWQAYPAPAPAPPAAGPLKQGGRPSAGYEDLRNQMVAQAQFIPASDLAKSEPAKNALMHGNGEEPGATTDGTSKDTGTPQAKRATALDSQVDTNVTSSATEGAGNNHARPRSAVTVSSSGSTDESVATAPEQVEQEVDEHQGGGNNSDTSEEA